MTEKQRENMQCRCRVNTDHESRLCVHCEWRDGHVRKLPAEQLSRRRDEMCTSESEREQNMVSLTERPADWRTKSALFGGRM
jgi:hypothetical protein